MDNESKIAVALAAGSLVVFAIFGFAEFGATGLFAFPFAMTIAIAVQVGLGLVAGLIVAQLIGASFGLVGHAAIKLAGIFAATNAISLVPAVGWLLALAAYFILLMALFELEGFEVIVFVIVLWGIGILFREFVLSALLAAIVA